MLMFILFFRYFLCVILAPNDQRDYEKDRKRRKDGKERRHRRSDSHSRSRSRSRGKDRDRKRKKKKEKERKGGDESNGNGRDNKFGVDHPFNRNPKKDSLSNFMRHRMDDDSSNDDE